MAGDDGGSVSSNVRATCLLGVRGLMQLIGRLITRAGDGPGESPFVIRRLGFGEVVWCTASVLALNPHAGESGI